MYITPPASAKSPTYQLRGFDSVYLTPGQTTTVSFSLSRYDLSIWNVVTQRWEIPSGTHGVTVGASSRDRRLTSSIVI
jgi:beta-glucosidase